MHDGQTVRQAYNLYYSFHNMRSSSPSARGFSMFYRVFINDGGVEQRMPLWGVVQRMPLWGVVQRMPLWEWPSGCRCQN